ncbi:MAG: ABC transporter ATP-binding protein [Chloroflexota bacterium]|nr:ABC transporter ATP-binding protein [Chloroflexota bacterium]
MDAPLLRVAEVTKTYPQTSGGDRLLVLERVSLEVAAAEVVSIIGASGCGKTTLLRIIDGLIPSDSGAVYCGDRKVDSPPAAFAMVFQDSRLLPWKTVRQNVEFAVQLKHHRRLRPDEKSSVLGYIEAVGLSRFSDHYPHQLSGGMQQRVGVARALAREPQVLLLDEPFGALDAQTRLLMQDWFIALREQFGFAALLVTHDIDEAVYMSSRCVVLKRAPGAVKAIVDVDLPARTQAARGAPEFGRYRSALWELLHADAEAASV